MQGKKVIARTGEKVIVAGQYRPSGGKTEYTFSGGDKVPPNNHGVRQLFVLVDRTKHKQK